MNSTEIGETYRQLGAQGADKLEIVIMLYDVMLDDLQRAIQALHSHDIEKRTAEIQHSLRVLEQLQGALDLEHGGDPARNLDQLYSMIRAKLLEAHWKSSEELLRRQIDILRPIREAWQEARTQHRQAAEPGADLPLPPSNMDATAMEWHA